jgi:dephospho-CoA kinase
MPQEEKEKLADFRILNQEKENLAAQVQKIHEQLLKLAQRKN